MPKEIILLDGRSLTIEEVSKVAKNNSLVEIAPKAMKLLQEGRNLVFQLADKGKQIYGFTTGVGWNKDKVVFKNFFEEYNRNLIYSHCAGIEPEASEVDVRAILLMRLNTFLCGCSGIQPEVATMYKDLLNHHIHPVIPERGSVGEGDITCLSHIGLTIIGEGEVIYRGIRMAASEALNKAKLEPVVLGPKDGLAIVSSNALGIGPGALLLQEIKNIIDISNIIYSISLEGLDGNITPLDFNVNKIKKMPGQLYSTMNVTKYLEDSYLFKNSKTKSVQDPLSFRNACAIHGAVKDALDFVWKYLLIQLNTTEDNPCLLLEEKTITSCANFESMTLAVGFEMLAISLSHLSKIACHRIIKLSTPYFTDLPRFLSPHEGSVLSFQAIQKTFTSLDTEIRHLANPSSMDYYSIAGDIEDHANGIPFIVNRINRILDNLRYILAIELLHAIQAIDLRDNVVLGKGTKKVYDMARNKIPFLNKDRVLTKDIKLAYNIIKSAELISIINDNA